MDELLHGHVRLDDVEEQVEQAKPVGVALDDGRPACRGHAGGDGRVAGKRLEQRLVVGVARVLGQRQKDLLLGAGVLVEVRTRPRELVGDGGERDLVVGMGGEEPCRRLLDLVHALFLLLGAARADELRHVSVSFGAGRVATLLPKSVAGARQISDGVQFIVLRAAVPLPDETVARDGCHPASRVNFACLKRHF